jgi:hypothetical protein
MTLVADARRWKLAAIHMSFIAGAPVAPPIPGAAGPGGAAAQG